MFHVFFYDRANQGWVESGVFDTGIKAANFASPGNQIEFRENSFSTILVEGTQE